MKPEEEPAEQRTDADTSQLLAERRQKLDELRSDGIDPYPVSFPDRSAIADVLGRYAGLEAGEESADMQRVAGRLSARRGHGKASFLDLVDRTGKIQLHARKDVLGDDYEGLVDLDLGDVVGIDGVPTTSPGRGRRES